MSKFLFGGVVPLLVSGLLPGCGEPRTSAPPPLRGPANETSGSTRAETPLVRAAKWLWSQQADDGGWHSETYGLLRSGQALTPFILHALLDVPPETVPRPRQAVERALEFLRRHVNAEGVIGRADPDVLEYPNYATAYAVRCLIRAGTDEDRVLIERMIGHLRREQYAEKNGFTPEHPAYGGWGFGGDRVDGEPGHMDLAHTRHVLEALRSDGTTDADVFARAEVFLRLVQRHPDDPRPQPTLRPPDAAARALPFDGGFYFSPVVLAANKGREASETGAPAGFRSYATATCDGILALVAAGVPRQDPRVQAAIGWIERHPRIDRPEGIPLDHPEPWHAALRFYHLAVRAEVYAAVDWPGDWRSRLRVLLAEWQDPDGRFVNRESHLMKEDDPLLATTLAVIALSESTDNLTPRHRREGFQDARVDVLRNEPD